MYEFQDEKIKWQMVYDKLLQKYQVQLAALYTIPVGLFVSLVTTIGYKDGIGFNMDMVGWILVVSIFSYIFLKDWLDDTEFKIDDIRRRMVYMEQNILIDKSNRRKRGNSN